MISDIFFKGKVKERENKELYEEDAVIFYLTIKLKDYEEFSIEKIKNLLEKLYGTEIIKNNKIQDFCNQHFKSKEKNYSLNIPKEEKIIYEKTDQLCQKIQQITETEYTKQSQLIKKEITRKDINPEEKLEKTIIYYYWKEQLTLKEQITLLYKYYYNTKNYYKTCIAIEEKLNKIEDSYNQIEITRFNLNKKQRELLISNNIFTIKNLKNIPTNAIICIFVDNTEKIIKELSKYTVNINKMIIDTKEKLEKVNNFEANDVLLKRINLQSTKNRTYEDIAKELNVTRQRIHQKEQKAVKKLLKEAGEADTLVFCLYKIIKKDEQKYITIDELHNYIQDEDLMKYLIIILTSSNTIMKIDRKMGIIYNSQEASLQEIIFHRKELNSNDIFINEIKESFIQGYNIKKDYPKLQEIIKEKYGDIEVPKAHAIEATIKRRNFVLIDRGTYISTEYVANISEKVISEIIEYIIKNQPIVYYSAIFSEFEEELRAQGINNRYYLKGCIDEKIPTEFTIERDRINTNTIENYTMNDAFIDTFKSFEYEFTIEDIKEKIPGFKDYTYDTYARAEYKNGLIQIGYKTYIYIDKLQITEETKKELKEYIDNLFKKFETDILTANKIYVDLKIKNKELFNKLNITSKMGDFELFSIIKYYFEDSYFYSRPIISTEKNKNIKSYLLIKNYASTQKSFSLETLRTYIYKMGLGEITNYLNFMDSLSDEFIQYDVGSMIKKEELDIKQEQLDAIEEFIDLLLRNGEIKLEYFAGYSYLPRINRKWNKYLLVGILRTYFKEKYEIKNTEKFYNKTDYIIRGKN